MIDEAAGPSGATDIQTQDQSDTTDVQLHNQLDTEDDSHDDHWAPDSDGESDSEIGHLSEEESSSIKTDLAKWAVKNKATRTSIDELLSVLQKHGRCRNVTLYD